MGASVRHLHWLKCVVDIPACSLSPARCNRRAARAARPPPTQLACLEMGDAVQFRYHWPRHMDLRVNNMPYRPYNRSTNARMGINQRDEPASIGERSAA